MSTRSIIAILNSDNTITGIYCHHDGYPDGVGNILVNNYTDENTIHELINLGDISSLRERIHPDPDATHNFESPQDGVVVAYHRDRNEPLKIHKWDSKEELQTQAYDAFWAEFLYLWDGKDWLVTWEGNQKWDKVVDVLN